MWGRLEKDDKGLTDEAPEYLVTWFPKAKKAVFSEAWVLQNLTRTSSTCNCQLACHLSGKIAGFNYRFRARRRLFAPPSTSRFAKEKPLDWLRIGRYCRVTSNNSFLGENEYHESWIKDERSAGNMSPAFEQLLSDYSSAIEFDTAS